MADKIRVNYPALEDMAKQCEMVANRLQELAQTGNKVGQQMQGGALVGQPGDAFVAALGVFQQRVNMLAQKFTEQAGDIRKAMADMQQADASAANDF